MTLSQKRKTALSGEITANTRLYLNSYCPVEQGSSLPAAASRSHAERHAATEAHTRLINSAVGERTLLKYFLNDGVWQGKCLVPPPRVPPLSESWRASSAQTADVNFHVFVFLLRPPQRFIFHVPAVSDLRPEDESIHVTERMDSTLYTGRRGESRRQKTVPGSI